ncbi:potassium channel family protein [Cellulophaga tyrosinoxydans]|uniref:Trk system potassium uptake protein TrkA n=1 Tax=Cellulophaga tyrosinoxydans TaxID=504486 RepID=A0A1W1YP53_9FLAO|nr:TrkA family potassium uptake protein [Cellulophaga tyrosinoxydans]SMC37518.1 trk system potassium uptake protein TrkA [Cellulophaga tyrosinoxydans]
MKIIIIGLGNFGMSAAIALSNTNHEVIAVDMDMEKISQIKDKVAHAVAFDAKKEAAYNSLPLKNTDLVIIAIGDRNGTAIMSTAIIKKLTNAKIIARASSSIEDTILQAMGVDQIVHPEKDYAERFIKTINISGSIDSLEVDDDYLVSEIEVPKDVVGKTILESEFRKKHHLNIITIIRLKEHKTLLGKIEIKKEVLGMPKPSTVLQENDILVVFGKDKNIKSVLK